MKSEKFSLYQNDGIWGVLEDATNDGTICVKSYFGADLIINRMNELAEQIRCLEKKCEELNKDRCDRDAELHQIYSRLGVEAFGEDIHKEALKEIGKLQEQLKNAIVSKFKIGQEVYTIDEWDMSICKFTIEQISIKDDIRYKSVEWRNWYNPNEIFATREEAEKRLAELKGEG